MRGFSTGTRRRRRVVVACASALVAITATGVAFALAGPGDTAGPKPDGTAITPIGWNVTPAGRQVNLVDGAVYADRPYAIAQRPDGHTFVISNDGQSTQSLMVVNADTGAIVQTIAYARPNALFVGLAYSPSGQKLYASAGGNNKIRVFDVDSAGRLTEGPPFVLPAGIPRVFGDVGPFPAGLAVSGDGARLYVVNNIDDSLSILNAATGAILSTTPVGSYPYGVTLSRDGSKAYVSNWGGKQAYGPGHVSVASLSPGSISVVNAVTGALVTTIPVGTHPDAMAVNPDTGDLYVANSDSDNVSVIDTGSNSVANTIDLAPYDNAPVGTNPDALTFSPDGNFLFVANSGNNDVDVVALNEPDMPILGSIPTAWYPTGVALSQDGHQLFVINGKGLGAGPNPNGPTPYHGSPPDQYTGSMLKGTLSIVDLPPLTRGRLERFTRQVRRNDGFDRVNGQHGHGFPPEIQHVIYVVKENRTYDQMFGDLSGNGDPSLALFKDESAPNQRSLKDRFVTLDNLYAASEVSADGWSWSTEANASTYDQKTWPPDYSGRNRGYDFEGGNFATAAGKDPENSYLWDRIVRNGISLRNYGFWVTGTIPAVVLPTEPELAPVTDLNFPGYNTSITDQTRIGEWLNEFAGYVANGSLPTVELVRLPNDHTVGTTPGSPSPRGMVADNDWALGKLVDAVSHSQYWASTAIFVVEDDAQNGPDHVDAHRMPAQVISPYTQRGRVDSTFYSTVSVLRSIEEILGIGPLTQFDAASNPMTASIGNTPNLTPYTAVRPTAFGEHNPPTAPMAQASKRMNFGQADRAPEQLLNNAIWKSVKGARSKMPAPRNGLFGAESRDRD